MSDLISRQAALAYPLSWEHYDKEHGDRKFICGVESYREYIEHLPSVDEWTPCSERLPEDVEIGEEYPTVIFCTKDAVYVGFYEYYRGGRWWAAEEYTVDNVIAWMPLPEPYKGGDTNAD